MSIDPSRATIEDLTRKVTITAEQRDQAYRRIEEMAVQQQDLMRQLAEKDATVRTLLDIISDYVTEQHARQSGVYRHLRVVKDEDDGIDVTGLPPFVD